MNLWGHELPTTDRPIGRRFARAGYFLAFFFTQAATAVPCGPLLAALSAEPSRNVGGVLDLATHSNRSDTKPWYERHTVENYAISFTGTPITEPVAVVTQTYYSDKFITRRSEIKRLDAPNAQVIDEMASKGLAVDGKGRVIFAGRSYEASRENAYTLMSLEGEVMRKLSHEGWKKYHSEIDLRLDFALEDYPKDWPQEFLNFLRRSAHEWDNAMHSSYVEVFRRASSGEVGERVGVFLNLSHPYFQYEIPAENLGIYRQRRHPAYRAHPLPTGTSSPVQEWIYTSGFPARRLTMEDFFGEELPLPRVRLAEDEWVAQNRDVGMRKVGGVKSEPRNWRIRQGVSPQVFGEILMQYLRVLYDSGESQDYRENGNFIYTYGPRPSVIRYAGIDPITNEKSRRGGLGFEILSPTPIVRYGLQWWKLRSTPRKMLDQLLNIERTRGWTAEEAENLREAFFLLSEGGMRSAGLVPANHISEGNNH